MGGGRKEGREWLAEVVENEAAAGGDECGACAVVECEWFSYGDASEFYECYGCEGEYDECVEYAALLLCVVSEPLGDGEEGDG